MLHENTGSTPRLSGATVAAFINKNSGERAAAEFVKAQLELNYGVENVFDLFPTVGPAIAEAVLFLGRVKPGILIVGGGDGTVSLAMDIVAQARARGSIPAVSAYIAVLPMGTGNDLSRTLGFGPGYVIPPVSAEKKFRQLLSMATAAQPSQMDRWNLTIRSRVEGSDATGESATEVAQPTALPLVKGSSSAATGPDPLASVEINPLCCTEAATPAADRRAEAKSSSAPDAARVHKLLVNYFSVGFDAAIAAKFGYFREANPKWCSTRSLNKAWYGLLGASALFTEKNFHRADFQLIIDGTAVKLPKDVKALVVSNVTRYAGGNRLWQDSRNRFRPPSIDDGMLEVTALFGVWHMAGVNMGARRAQKVAQGAHVKLTCPATYAMQYDGEPLPRRDAAVTHVEVELTLHSKPLVLIAERAVTGRGT